MKIAMILSSAMRKRLFSEKAMEKLQSFGEVVVNETDDTGAEQVKKVIAGADIAVTSWGSQPLTGDILAAAPGLKLVVHAAGSVKPIVSDELWAKGVRVTGSPKPLGEGVAETALGLSIAASKNVFQLSKNIAAGGWNEGKDDIRELFASTQDAKMRGFTASRFSFNVKGGRCEACQGDGLLKIEMHFLPDIYVPCEVCKGKRYNRETLEVRYKGKSIYEVLEMTVDEALPFFENIPRIYNRLKTLEEVGLGYVKLGQPSTELSGGEAQRVKLATELSKRSTGKTIYILDEPTTGLHSYDVHRLIEVLQKLVEAGNTVVVIEHNLDVIKTADYLIDLGPEGGDGGGQIVAAGTPEEVAACPESYTGQYLKKMLERGDRMQNAEMQNAE